ncbi:MAG: type IV secretory system conjugative DNA transfer family protein [Nitrospira sp.]|nr:type IV secretory system conjugative DNA transfer family protein [Nitrospira sp.]
MAGILDDFPRGVDEGRIRTENRAPQGEWLPTSRILNDSALTYNPNRPGGKLFLGSLEERFIGVADDRHIITVAGSRAGKGVSVIIPNLIFYPGSVLAIDPKGELASITGRRRAEGLGQKVFVLDPFGRTSETVRPYRASFNPMGILTEDNRHIVEDAGLIADALVIPGGGDIHWDETAKNFIEGLILHVATWPTYEGRRHLVTVRELLVRGVEPDPDMFDSPEAMEEFLKNVDNRALFGLRMEMEANDRLGGFIQAAATEMFERDPKEMNSVLSSARRHTTFLGFPAMKEVLQDHDELTDLRGLKTTPEGMTIYLCLPAGRLGTCNRWLRLFVNLALEAMEREQGRARAGSTTPVLLCLDEFATLGRMEQMEAAAGQIAGLGCKLWPILQDIGQLEALYKDRWETFIGNAGVLQFFANNDVRTLDYISKRLGQTSVVVKGIGSDTNKRQEVHSLLSPEEVSRYFGRNAPYQRQLIIRAGEAPMVIGRVRYHEERGFRGLYDDPYAAADRTPRKSSGEAADKPFWKKFMG